jgi:hypothetical protein
MKPLPEELLALGQRQGYLTVDQVNDLLPGETLAGDHLDDLLYLLENQGIDVLDEAPTGGASEGRTIHWGAERRLCQQMEEAQQRIRQAVCRVGMAAGWHVAKASDIVRDPGALDLHVVPLGEAAAAAYLGSLPGLIKRVRSQDRKCAKRWHSRAETADLTAFEREQGKLAELLLQFRFRFRTYERLVRQPQNQKWILLRANELLGGEAGRVQEVRGLESMLRLTLLEFVKLEEAIAEDLRILDEKRGELVAAHAEFARKKAETLAPSDPDAVSYALGGLRKAADHYDYRRGYRFSTYAQWWIKKAVRDKKTWGT